MFNSRLLLLWTGVWLLGRLQRQLWWEDVSHCLLVWWLCGHDWQCQLWLGRRTQRWSRLETSQWINDRGSKTRIYKKLTLFLKVNLEHNGVFLWIEKDNNDFKNSIARIVSPIYQNSQSNCTLRFKYFIAGNLNGEYLKPSIHPVGAEFPITLDFLSVTDEWKEHEIGIGRRRGQFQVQKTFLIWNFFYI